MIENFIEYMWYLFTTPFKKGKKALNKWYILCRVFGRRLDEIKEDILRARDEGMVATCNHEMLSIHGDDRGLYQYKGEAPENYRKRIAMHEELYKLGGSNQGIILALQTLGYTAPEIIRANELNATEDRWAEFYVVIVMDVDEEHPISFDLTRKTVRKWKEVGAKDNYLFRYNLVISEIHSMALIHVLYTKYLHYFNYLKTDGTWQLDGSHILDEERVLYPIREVYSLCVHHQETFEVLWHEEHNLIFLDGTWQLDGSKIIDSWQKTEVL